MTRLLGLDYGGRTIGVALSDPGRAIAGPHAEIPHIGWGPSARAVKELALKAGTDEVVLGLPLNEDGSEGAQAAEVRGFAEALMRQGLQVAFQDERHTSQDAEESLKQGGKTWKEAKALVDRVAAALILQDYLDRMKAPNT